MNKGFSFLKSVGYFSVHITQISQGSPMKHLNRIMLIAITLFISSSFAQRYMEKLNRGFVAVPYTTGDSVFLSWRYFGTDPAGLAFNIYKNNVKLNADPVTGSTNFVDASGGTGSYTLKTVLNDTESTQSESPVLFSSTGLAIPLDPPHILQMIAALQIWMEMVNMR